jgi:hypothetical protein
MQTLMRRRNMMAATVGSVLPLLLAGAVAASGTAAPAAPPLSWEVVPPDARETARPADSPAPPVRVTVPTPLMPAAPAMPPAPVVTPLPPIADVPRQPQPFLARVEAVASETMSRAAEATTDGLTRLGEAISRRASAIGRSVRQFVSDIR